jgi:hypothetical protein
MWLLLGNRNVIISYSILYYDQDYLSHGTLLWEIGFRNTNMRNRNSVIALEIWIRNRNGDRENSIILLFHTPFTCNTVVMLMQKLFYLPSVLVKKWTVGEIMKKNCSKW